MDANRSPRTDTPAARTPSLDGFSLPGWIYRDADFLEAEKEGVCSTSWQIVCHLSDIPRPGDYHTLDFLNEPLVAVRSPDGGVRTFFNVGKKSRTSRDTRRGGGGVRL